MKKNNLIILGLAMLLAALSLLPSGEETINTKLIASGVSPEIPVTLSPPPQIEAKSAYAYDLSSEKIIFEKNSGEILPLASITKIVSALALLVRLDADEEVEITKRSVMTEGASPFAAGEHFKVRDLMAFVMVESSNDAVEALVEHLARKNGVLPAEADLWFLSLMRNEAAALGAPTMMFYNPTGLDASYIQAGAYGSAQDLMKIIKATQSSELWQFGNMTEVTSIKGRTYKLKPTNLLESELNLLVGGKTGFTDLAGGNLLVIIQYPLDHPIGIVVLGSTADGRFSDVKAIFDWYKEKTPVK